MTLAEFTTEFKVKERVEYIFRALQSAFSAVLYDERDTIIGIGEEGKYLLCYFLLGNDGEKQVKFKSRKNPVLLMGELSEIDNAIQETVELFRTNDMNLRHKRSVDGQVAEKCGTRYIDSEKLGFAELMAKIQPSYDMTELNSVAPRYLTQTLATVGITHLGDLRSWSYCELMKICGFGVKKYQKLQALLLRLSNEAIPEALLMRNLAFLHIQATRKNIEKWDKDTRVEEYLASIGYDETCFGVGSLGRVLCLRQQARQYQEVRSDKDVKAVQTQYSENKPVYEELAVRVEAFVTEILQCNTKLERDFLIVRSYLSEANSTVRSIGERFGLSGERVRQIYKKSLTTTTTTFSLKKEEGLYRFIKKGQLLKEIESKGLEAFFVHLLLTTKAEYVKAVKRIIFDQVVIPEQLYETIDSVYCDINRKQVTAYKEENFDANRLLYKGFKILLNDEGEILTDILLLMKLKEKRWELATERHLPAYMIYTNKQLVALATYQPISKELYVGLRGFTANTWSQLGSIMVDVIKEYKEKMQ